MTPTLKGRIGALLAGLVLTAFLMEGAVRIVMPHWRDFYSGRFIQMTAVPGYPAVPVGRPGFDGFFAQNNDDFRVRITINDFGLRNPDPVEEAGGRIWIIGDSMAFGWGVERDEMYSTVIAGLVRSPTYNVASPGTDVCGYQSLLARMPKSPGPRAVIMGLILENDLKVYDCRAEAAINQQVDEPGMGPSSVGEVKVALTQFSALYNFLAVALKQVGAIKDFLVWTGLVNRGHAYRTPPTEDRIKSLADKTANEVSKLRSMLPPGIPFVVLVAPVRFEIKLEDPEYRTLRLTSVAALRRRGIDVIDPYPSFRATGFEDTHFAHDGHWTALGHRIAAEAAAKWLASKLPHG